MPKALSAPVTTGCETRPGPGDVTVARLVQLFAPCEHLGMADKTKCLHCSGMLFKRMKNRRFDLG